MINKGRRTWSMAAGVAVATGACGLGWTAWRTHSAGDGAVEALWSSVFEAPDGTRLNFAGLRGSPLVLNFWATWCPPCVREMPALDRFAREFAGRGWRVVGLAADNLDAVRGYLGKSPVSYTIALAGFEGIELSRRLGNTSGGLPFTLVIGREGLVRSRHVGETRLEQLIDWAKAFG